MSATNRYRFIPIAMRCVSIVFYTILLLWIGSAIFVGVFIGQFAHQTIWDNFIRALSPSQYSIPVRVLFVIGGGCAVCDTTLRVARRIRHDNKA